MADITLPADYVITNDHGPDLKLSALTFNEKGQSVTAVFEMHDGVNYLGPKVTARVSATTATITKLNGDVKTVPAVDFSLPAVAALIDLAKVITFITSNGGDLTQGT